MLTRETRLARVLAAIEREEGAADPAVRSPMPGTVVSVSVGNGDTVEAGQVLLAVEAMKMEHQLVAPLDGTVHISVGSGDLVKADQVLATIHPAVTRLSPRRPRTRSRKPSSRWARPNDRTALTPPPRTPAHQPQRSQHLFNRPQIYLRHRSHSHGRF